MHVENLSDSVGTLAKSAVLLMVGSVVGRGFGLVGETIIARELEPALYGDVALAYTIVFTLGSVVLLGVHQGITRLGSVEDDPQKQREVILAGVLTIVASGLVSTLLVVLFPAVIERVVTSPGLSDYLVLVAPFLVLYPLSHIVISVLRIQERAAAVVLTRALLGRILPLAVLGIALLIGLETVAAVAYWISVPVVIIVIGGVLAAQEFDLLSVKTPPREQFVSLWSFSWPLAMGSVIFLLLAQLDVLMIAYFLDSSDVGFYRAIQPLRQSATIFMGAFSFLFLPLASNLYERGELLEMDGLFSIVTKWVTVLTLPIVAAFVFRADEIVRTFYGSAYQEAALPLMILSAGLFTRTVAGPDGDVVQAIDKTEIELYAGSIGLVGNFVLNLFLVPRYGISGAAIATVCGYVLYNGVELWMIYRECGASPFSYDTTKTVLVSLGGIWLLSWFVRIGTGLTDIVSFAVLASVVTVSSLLVTKSVDGTDMVLLERVEDRMGRNAGFVRRALQFGMR